MTSLTLVIHNSNFQLFTWPHKSRLKRQDNELHPRRTERGPNYARSSCVGLRARTVCGMCPPSVPPALPRGVHCPVAIGNWQLGIRSVAPAPTIRPSRPRFWVHHTHSSTHSTHSFTVEAKRPARVPIRKFPPPPPPPQLALLPLLPTSKLEPTLDV